LKTFELASPLVTAQGRAVAGTFQANCCVIARFQEEILNALSIRAAVQKYVSERTKLTDLNGLSNVLIVFHGKEHVITVTSEHAGMVTVIALEGAGLVLGWGRIIIVATLSIHCNALDGQDG